MGRDLREERKKKFKLILDFKKKKVIFYSGFHSSHPTFDDGKSVGIYQKREKKQKQKNKLIFSFFILFIYLLGFFLFVIRCINGFLYPICRSLFSFI